MLLRRLLWRHLRRLRLLRRAGGLLSLHELLQSLGLQLLKRVLLTALLALHTTHVWHLPGRCQLSELLRVKLLAKLAELSRRDARAHRRRKHLGVESAHALGLLLLLLLLRLLLLGQTSHRHLDLLRVQPVRTTLLSHPLQHGELLRREVAWVERGSNALLLLTLSHLQLLLQLLLKLLVDLRVCHG